MLGLIWIQTVWHSDDIPERMLCEVVNFEKIQQKTKNMQNVLAYAKSEVMLIILHPQAHCPKCFANQSKDL